jgi:LuxR family maltose regulon positive regulatory protein
LDDAGTAAGGQAHPAWLARQIELDRARLLTLTGHPDQCLAVLGGLADPAAGDVAVVRAAALLAGGEPEQAAQVITPVVEADGVRRPVAIDAWLVLATLAAYTDDLGRARDALRQALRLAASEGQRRAVHQVWAQLRRVLRNDEELAEQCRTLGAGAERTDHARSGGSGGSGNVVIVDPLSKREMDVLGGMAAMLPTEEIAASMYVSINTVKTHVRSILRKLSVSRRNEAVRRARALGLI